MTKTRFQLSALVGVAGATLAALTLAGAAAASTTPATIANANSGTWNGSVFLCAAGNGAQPTIVSGDELASALSSGSSYSNSISGTVTGQSNATGTASLSCDLPSGAMPILDADGIQMVADNNDCRHVSG